MQGKPVSASRVVTHYQPFPADANNNNNMFGGQIMRRIDTAAYFSAVRHTRGRLVTAAASVFFLSPIQLGEIMLIQCSVNAAWGTSLEVGVRVEGEHPHTGARTHVCTAYLTFVAVDENGRPIPVPPLIAETPDDERRMADASRRMALSRLEQRHNVATMSGLALETLPGLFAVCRMPKGFSMPDFCTLSSATFRAMAASDKEISILVEQDAAEDLAQANPGMEIASGYRCLKVDEADSLHKIGLIASLTTLLASSRISVLTVSSYTTLYILVEQSVFDTVLDRLRSAGHSVTTAQGAQGAQGAEDKERK